MYKENFLLDWQFHSQLLCERARCTNFFPEWSSSNLLFSFAFPFFFAVLGRILGNVFPTRNAIGIHTPSMWSNHLYIIQTYPSPKQFTRIPNTIHCKLEFMDGKRRKNGNQTEPSSNQKHENGTTDDDCFTNEDYQLILSPAARLFHSPKFNCFVLVRIGSKTRINPEAIRVGLMENLSNHPRFCSKLVLLTHSFFTFF